MPWLLFVVGAGLSWGTYGPMLHEGQVQLGNALRAAPGVAVAYFLGGVLVPVITLGTQGEPRGFTSDGTVAATAGGALGALGAVCIIFSFRYGGLPFFVMPLVCGGAPLVNVLFTMWLHPPMNPPNPILYLGFVLAALGAGLVLRYRPT